MLLALALALTLGDISPRFTARDCSRGPGGRSSRGVPCGSVAFFELAPASGAGLGATCACAAVTGAKGEAVTWARASSAYCTKEGLATTGLTNSSLVSCGSNLPRVEVGSDGVAGLLHEQAATNLTIRSQELDNVAWGLVRSTVAFPTVTPNTATAPDGTLTADRVQIAACPAVGNYSLVVQFRGATFNVNPATFGIYLKGTSSSGTVGLYADDGAVGNDYRTCSYNSTTWTRCSLTSVQGDLVQWGFGCLNIAAAPGSGDTGAADVLAWQGDFTNSPYASSPIATTTASTTRALDTAVVTIPTATTNTVSMAATVSPEATSSADMTSFATVLMVGVNVDILSYPSGSPRMFSSAAASTTFTSGAQRFYGYDDNVNVGVGYGVNTSTAAAGVPANRWSTTVYVGRDNGGALQPDAILSRICLDPSPTRCR